MLRNLRTLIVCFNEGGEPSFDILKSAANEASFFGLYASNRPSRCTEHSANLASILNYIPPPTPSASETPLQRGPPVPQEQAAS
uniref:Uncharacterized protein n=1 Tax=Trichogramma kaykai TaxID=54128 RepID=A0ABD2VYT7_9HYME